MMPGKFYECSIFRKFSAGEGSIQTQTELIYRKETAHIRMPFGYGRNYDS